MRLINHHAVRHLARNSRGQLSRLLGFFATLLPVDVGLQTLVEIVHAHARINDGHDDQNEGDDREEGQRPPGRQVLLVCLWSVHANELEQEIGHCSEVKQL